MKRLEKFINTPSLYDRVKLTGCKTSNHYSDFYFEKTQATAKIAAEYNNTHRGTDKITTFIDNIDKKTWYKANFSYDPYWHNIYNHKSGGKK